LIVALVLWALPASAREVLVVESVRSALYDQALKGFAGACPADSTTVVLSDYADPQLARVIREERPRLVVAVGDGALAALRRIHRAPVVAMMALGLRSQEGGAAGVAGVELFVRPEQYLSLFKKLGARRVGVLYDPARTGWYLRLARAAARQQGLELVTREVNEPRQVLRQLTTLKGAVDALWLLPDSSAVTRETLEGYFLFAQAQAIPVVSFSAAHLRLGALAALEADRVELGRQAGELALQLLWGEAPAELPPLFPRRVSLRTNDSVARRLHGPAEPSAPPERR